jgi:tripartite-type tricarboxylate transporter receptor subunit TctC
MPNRRRTFLQAALGIAAAHALPRIAYAQAFPSRPIRCVIPFPPGGAFDAVGRPLAERFKAPVGLVVVENVGGGGGSIGASMVAHARPDGHTLLLGGTLTHLNEALLKSKPLYDPAKDLDAIAAVAANVLAIAIHPSVPARTLGELIEYARAHPGELSYAHAGVGSIQHLAGELFKSLIDAPSIAAVPYRGTGPAVTDLIGGQVPMALPGITRQVLDFHRAGKLRILAVTSAKRLAAAPELPTAAESGFPGLTIRGTIGLLAPGGTPAPIVAQLARAAHTVTADPAFQQMLVEAGIEPIVDSGPEQFRRSLADDVALWAPVVKSLDLKLD